MKAAFFWHAASAATGVDGGCKLCWLKICSGPLGFPLYRMVCFFQQLTLVIGEGPVSVQ